jgi:fibronectin-binding autotransporter adhesin
VVWDPKTGGFAFDNDDLGGTAATIKFLSTDVLRVPEDPLAGNAQMSPRGANIGRNEFAQSINDAYTNGVLVGVTSVRKQDEGTWILSGNNTNTGSYQIDLGTLEFATPSSLPSAAQVDFISTGVADRDVCLGVLVGGGGWTSGDVDSLIAGLSYEANSSSSIGLDTFNGDFTYGTAITGTKGVRKLGPNTLTLTGTHTYNGSTRVREGTLLVNGSTAAAIAGRQIANSLGIGASMIVQYDPNGLGSATLGGSGTVGGVTYIQRGARIQGGDAAFAGTLTLGGLLIGNNQESDWSRLRFNIAAGGKIATTSFAVNGTNHVVQILDPVLTVGTNTLITYTGGSIGGSNGFGGLVLDNLPAGVTANLVDTGSAVQLAVTAVPPVVSPNLDYSFLGGGVIQFSWTGAFKLQSQTNNLSVGLSTNWVDYPIITNPVNVTNSPGVPVRLFRLKSL